MSNPIDPKSLLALHAVAAEGYLRDRLPIVADLPDAPARLREAIDYSLFAGGKRLRPALVLESARALGGEEATALPAAGAIELIHTFSLVHDDLPAMDNDDLRRGRPTNHKVFGEAMAILAGDAMTTLAFELIATESQPSVAARLVAELAHAAGPVGMIGGQVLDIDAEGRSLSPSDLRDVHRRKTGALITCACRLGAISAGASEEALARITNYGRHLGLAFQIADDLLDLTATSESMGKATHKDAAAGKNTYPSLLGLEGARAAAFEQVESAIAALSGFDAQADTLRTLARFTIERST